MFCRTFFLRLRQVFGSIVFGSIRMLGNVTQTIYTSRWWIGKWKCDLFSSNWYQIWPIWSNCLDFTIESLFATQKCKFRNRGLDHAKDYLVKRNVFWNSWHCQCSCVHLVPNSAVSANEKMLICNPKVYPNIGKFRVINLHRTVNTHASGAEFWCSRKSDK